MKLFSTAIFSRTTIVAAVSAVADTLFFRRKLRVQLAQANAIIHDLENDIQRDEESARAQLLQLRVHQESVGARTGFMVSAFIPTGVLERLNSGTAVARLVFRDRIAAILVEHALKGLFRVSKSGTMVAMVFEKLGPGSSKQIASPVFETKDGKRIIAPLANSLDVRLIQEAQRRESQ